MSKQHATGRALVKTRYPGVYRRGNRYAVRFVGPDGRVRQQAARTLAEARRLRAELTTDVERGEYRADTKITFAAYAATWIESYAGRTSRGIRPETLAEYRRDLRPALARFGRVRLAEVTAPMLRDYARAMAEQERLAPATVRRRLAPVKALLATANEDGVIRANPAAGLRLNLPVSAEHDPDGEEVVKALTIDELARLITEVPEGWQQTLVSLLAQTGLRVSEALGLRWRDIDVTGRRLNVRQRVRSGKAGAPKSGRGRRDVPLSGALVRELAAIRLASAWSRDADLVFAGDAGAPRWARGLYGWLKPAAERAGVGWAGFHALRHTAASRWLAAGLSLAVVSRLLGHADPGFTLRVYVHALPSDLPDGEQLAAAVGLS